MSTNKITLILSFFIVSLFVFNQCTAKKETPSNSIVIEFEQRNKSVLSQNANLLFAKSPQEYETAITRFQQLDQQNLISYDAGANQRIACAERVYRMLALIEPSLAKSLSSNKNLAQAVYADLKSQTKSELTTDPNKVGNLALTIYYNDYENGEPAIGHIGLLFRANDGTLKEFSNSSSSKTQIHNSFADAVKWYSGDYSKAAILPIK